MMFSKFSISDNKNNLDGVMANNYAIKKIIDFIDKSDDKTSISLSWLELNAAGEEEDIIVSIYSFDELVDGGDRTLSNYPDYEFEILKALTRK